MRFLLLPALILFQCLLNHPQVPKNLKKQQQKTLSVVLQAPCFTNQETKTQRLKLPSRILAKAVELGAECRSQIPIHCLFLHTKKPTLDNEPRLLHGFSPLQSRGQVAKGGRRCFLGQPSSVCCTYSSLLSLQPLSHFFEFRDGFR